MRSQPRLSDVDTVAEPALPWLSAAQLVQRDAFLARHLQDPKDLATIAAYADWLREQGFDREADWWLLHLYAWQAIHEWRQAYRSYRNAVKRRDHGLRLAWLDAYKSMRLQWEQLVRRQVDLEGVLLEQEGEDTLWKTGDPALMLEVIDDANQG